MTRNELITPEGKMRCRPLQVGEEYRVGDWCYRSGTTEAVFITEETLELMRTLADKPVVTVSDKPVFRMIEENKQ